MVSRDDSSLPQFYHRVLHLFITGLSVRKLWFMIPCITECLLWRIWSEETAQSQDAQKKNNNMCEGFGSSKDGLLSPLLGKDGAGLVLGFWVIGQLGRAGGHGAF